MIDFLFGLVLMLLVASPFIAAFVVCVLLWHTLFGKS